MISRSHYSGTQAAIVRENSTWRPLVRGRHAASPGSIGRPQRAAGSARFGAIDALRGAAMILVCLAHFSGVYLWQESGRDWVNYLGVITQTASPTFVIVSGMVVGFLAVTDPAGFEELRIKLLDRGVFLLVIGHLILSITVTPALSAFPRAYRASFITDAIAIAVIVGPTLVTRSKAATRIALGAALFLVNWWAVIQWHPTGAVFVLFKRYLIGTLAGQPGEIYSPVFAVIPWFAVYIAATALGETVGKMYATGNRKGADQFLARAGALCFVLAGTFHIGTMLLRRIDPGVISPDSRFLTFFSIYEKFPPGPVYLAFYGGAGIMMLATILEIERRRKLSAFMNRLRQIGRASLFTFIAQYAVYVAFLERLDIPYTRLWPALFVLSIIVLASGAAVWDRHDGNRFLTVGLAPLLRRRSRRGRSAVATPVNVDAVAMRSGRF